MSADKAMQGVIRRILKDIAIDMADEFDQNFTRQAFFTEAWARRKGPLRPGGATLVDTGSLRRSIKVRRTDTAVIFETFSPYAAIHNDGGEITVTTKMKRFFWWKYMSATGAFGRKKDGTPRKDKRTVHLSEVAEFWKALALKKVGSKIIIPRRRFLGEHPDVEKVVTGIIETALKEYFDQIDLSH